ncbi:hypothetical protein POG14_17460 [Clostridium paraputrificum]|uniref:hypothetical protein n=1 Tax=Clostridium paraputrificum TaxID=29363 RepID=UPI001897A4F0|nr:hypothetical protein [Clostridium paraputrificum]MDC0803960.1 hypothetical protein [Clostridium paraputrificum]
MNIFENFIEPTGAKKPQLNTKEVLEYCKGELISIESNVNRIYKEIKNNEEKLRKGGFSSDYIKEHIEKNIPIINSNIEGIFNNKLNGIKERLKLLKERAAVSLGNKDIALNNLMKVQTVLPTLSEEDKKLLFYYSKDKDPKVLEILYLNTKNTNQSLALDILDYLEEFTGQKEIRMVENQVKQIEGLKGLLNYDYISKLDEAYSNNTMYNTVGGGAVNRIIGAFIDDIDKVINEIYQTK